MVNQDYNIKNLLRVLGDFAFLRYLLQKVVVLKDEIQLEVDTAPTVDQKFYTKREEI